MKLVKTVHPDTRGGASLACHWCINCQSVAALDHTSVHHTIVPHIIVHHTTYPYIAAILTFLPPAAAAGSEERFKSVSKAYALLADVDKRERFDTVALHRQ